MTSEQDIRRAYWIVLAVFHVPPLLLGLVVIVLRFCR